jgi:valyl-tRNA synthetase
VQGRLLALPLSAGRRREARHDGADHIVVATTRPETMLADMAVAVNADDPRYKPRDRQGNVQPITGRRFRSWPTNMPIPNWAGRGEDHAGA